jgi:hypothetical protein
MRIVALLFIASACGGEVANRYNGAQIGQPCTPAEEADTAFLGFDAQQVSVELPTPDADPGVLVCLVNHFRGRVTCPYGQDPSGQDLASVDGASGGPFPNGIGPCETPSGPVVGDATADPRDGAQVQPQCSDRRAASVVTWSCRCANPTGATDDGATYCSCPSGTTCTQLIDPVGDSNVAGAYCIQSGTDYESFNSCTTPCDPSTTTCP